MLTLSVVAYKYRTKNKSKKKENIIDNFITSTIFNNFFNKFSMSCAKKKNVLKYAWLTLNFVFFFVFFFFSFFVFVWHVNDLSKKKFYFQTLNSLFFLLITLEQSDRFMFICDTLSLTHKQKNYWNGMRWRENLFHWKI